MASVPARESEARRGSVPGNSNPLRDAKPRAAGDEDRRQFEHTVRRHETPERQAHPGHRARRADHANHHAVERHHVDRAKPRRDAHCERRERDAHVIRHDGARRQRLHGQDRVGPHLAAIDRLYHLRTKDAHLEVRIDEGQHWHQQPPRQRRWPRPSGRARRAYERPADRSSRRTRQWPEGSRGGPSRWYCGRGPGVGSDTGRNAVSSGLRGWPPGPRPSDDTAGSAREDPRATETSSRGGDDASRSASRRSQYGFRFSSQ